MSTREQLNQLPPIKIISSEQSHSMMDVSYMEEALYEKTCSPSSKEHMRFVLQHAVRDTLPYGRWVCFDGREVLFNRGYQPIMQRKDGACSYADRSEWVDHATIETTQYFYNDVTTPERFLLKHLGSGVGMTQKEMNACKKSLHICLDMLTQFTPEESHSVNTRYSVRDLLRYTTASL